MSLFLSTFISKIDEKNRVVLPKEFRLAVGAEHLFVAFRSHKIAAIDCFTISRMQKLSDDIDAKLDPFSIDRDSFSSTIFADAVIMRYDKTGRFILPEKMFTHALVDTEIAFVGCGATFQLWNPAKFEEHQKKVRMAIEN